MKLLIVIPDGAADEPQEALCGKTPLEAAHTPAMDDVARRGIVGLSNNVPPSQTPASDVATLSLFGYDPDVVYTGRAPLEARAMGITLGANDWAVRCNLVYAPDGAMRDFTAGHVDNATGKSLLALLQERLGGPRVVDGVPVVLEFHAGVSYRNLLVVRGGSKLFTQATKGQPPHDIPDQPMTPHLPKGPGSTLLNELMVASIPLFMDAPANKARLAAGQKPATQCWLWGMGRAPVLKSFEERFGLRGAILSAVDLVRGVGQLIGWERIDVPGATGYLDTDYAAKGRWGTAALAQHDVVCVHVEAPDEASHEGRLDAKVKAIEEIDRHIVGPIMNSLERFPECRILIEPDHRTTLRTRAHSYGAVPFALAGYAIKPNGATSYNEVSALATGLLVDPGHGLMERALNPGGF